MSKCGVLVMEKGVVPAEHTQRGGREAGTQWGVESGSVGASQAGQCSCSRSSQTLKFIVEVNAQNEATVVSHITE